MADPKTFLTVARAYRAARRDGTIDPIAYAQALGAFRDRHPDASDREVGEAVSSIIATAAARHPDWFWRGVAAVLPRPPSAYSDD